MNHVKKIKELKGKLKTLEYLMKNTKELDLSMSLGISVGLYRDAPMNYEIYGDNYKILKNIKVDLLREIAKFEQISTDRFVIYSDGSSFPQNPGYMGLGSVTIDADGNETQLTRYAGEGTNNLAELLSALVAITQLEVGSKIDIVTDSMYVYKGIMVWNEIWRKNGYTVSNGDSIKNLKYWQCFNRMTADYDIEAYWIKSHQTGEFFNNNADKLARFAVVGKDDDEKASDYIYVYDKKLGKYL